MSVEDAEADDIPPIDAALLQDRFDEYPEFSNIKVEPVPDEPAKFVETPDKKKKEEPKTGIPSLDEWQDFIGRIVLRNLTSTFLSLAFRDIEDDLTDREREMIKLTKDDLKEMSAPLASLAHKSKFGRKRGRSLIASSDSAEAVIALGIWMRRVNKISSKYRKQRKNASPSTIPGFVESDSNGYSGSNDGEGPGFGAQGFGVYNPGTG